MTLQLLLVLLSIHEVTLAPFQPVSTPCIYWDSLNIYSNGHDEKLHCILDENDQLGIVNVTWKRIQPGYCPFFDRFSKQIHVKLCDTELGTCPDQDVLSYLAIKYSACYSKRQRNETDNITFDVKGNPTLYTENQHSICENCYNMLIMVSTLSGIILVTIVGLYIFEKCQKNKRETNRESSSKDGNYQFREDVYPMEQNGHAPLIRKSSQTKDDKDELMNLCWRLVKIEFKEEEVDLGGLAMNIPEKDREHIREKLQKVLNALSTNTC